MMESTSLAYELKQTPDDLTRFARTYAVTGDPKYEYYFRKIAAMRDGREAHPKEHTPFYWDCLAAGAVQQGQEGETYIIAHRMSELGLTDEEKDKLFEAKRESDNLINLEDIAMNAVKGMGPDMPKN